MSFLVVLSDENRGIIQGVSFARTIVPLFSCTLNCSEIRVMKSTFDIVPAKIKTVETFEPEKNVGGSDPLFASH